MEMKTFEFEITETLQRVVEVKAESSEIAFKIVKESYQNEEIVLDDSDFVGKEIKEFKHSKDNNIRNLINELVDYLWKDEEKHFYESGKPKNHIFHTLSKIKLSS